MIARVLPKDEWGRMKDPDLPVLLPFLDPEEVRIVVIEEAGEIVASVAVMRITHYEGLWIDPKHGLGVMRALRRKAAATAETWANGWVMAGAADDRMRDVLGRMGAAPIPLETFMLNLGGESCRLQS